MSTSVDTNTVRVSLPSGLELQLATEALKRFGDVSHVEVLPGSKPILSAVFFDVRSAGAAQAELGDDRCKMGPQTGSRISYLPSGAQISVSDIRGASSVKPDPDNAGGFIVEFFDTRDAQRLQALVGEMPVQVGETPPGIGMPPGLEPPPGLSLPAAPVTSSEDQRISDTVPAASEVADAATNPEHTEVLMTELPKALCAGSYLETMLEEAGLDEFILSCTIHCVSTVGEARLMFSTRRSAKKCVKHFDGRGWDHTGIPVSAKILTAKSEKLEKPKKEKKQKKKLFTKDEPSEEQSVREQVEVQANMTEAMSHFFASEVGQKLLLEQSQSQFCIKTEMSKEGTTGINWDDFEDWSDDEQQKSA